VAVAETGGDGQAETIEDTRSFGKLHLRPVANGLDFFALDEDDAVANGFFRGTDMNRGTH
jgi:hypothetical protein